MSDLDGGVLARARRIAGSLLTMLETRSALLAAETEAYVDGVLQRFWFGLFGLLLGVLSLAAVGVAVVLAVDPGHRVAATLAVAAAYALVAVLCALGVRRCRQARGPWLRLTREELRRDRAAVTGAAP